MRRLVIVLSCCVALPLAAQGNSRWREIGKTASGNTVYIDPTTVRRADGIVTATVRSTYATPSQTPRGPITASRAVAMFDCAAKTVAVKETIIYHDERRGTIYEKRTPANPGFGPAFRSNFSGIAMDYLCAAPPR